MFGMGSDSRRRSASAGSDLRYDLSISLEQAFSGDQIEISLTVPSKCESCNGTGANKGSQPKQCGQCGGYGKVRAQQGFFTIERTCQDCAGTGRTISNPCKKCSGSGVVIKDDDSAIGTAGTINFGTNLI